MSEAPSSASVVRIRGLKKSFGANRVLDGIDLDVRKGEVIGYSGDSGYSEAPHLHYTVAYAGAGNLLCPTDEPGFNDRGWLLPELRGYRP